MKYIINGRCTVCPRGCLADRERTTGFCGYPKSAYIARASIHYWEEPCLSGGCGSGTVFFSGCNLGCVFCQNEQISHHHNRLAGTGMTVSDMADLFLHLQEMGVNNINLVSATHFTPVVRETLAVVKPLLHIPVVWNSGGYEKAEVIRELEGLVDIFLPDIKYYSPVLSAKYSSAPDYFTVAAAAVAEMLRQQPEAVFSGGLMLKGVIIRHLVLPNHTLDSIKILDQIKERFGTEVTISLMSQYLPKGLAADYPELNRRLYRKEYKRVRDYLELSGFGNGYLQEMDSASSDYIPDFSDAGLL